MASTEETSQERILAKLEPIESSYWLEGSTAAKVETSIAATWEDKASSEDSY